MSLILSFLFVILSGTLVHSFKPLDDDPYISQAKQILAQNWLGHSTKPAPQLYPHQWSWDSAFIAIGKSRYNQDQAQEELRTLFQAQWKNGLVPHIVFNPNTSSYFPGPDFWNTTLSPYAPRTPQTSGIVQPPVHATAVWQIFLNARGSNEQHKAFQFLYEMFPKLALWHDYLARERTALGSLIYIRHPWESGMDNSPLWDVAFSNMDLKPGMVPPYNRSDTNFVNSTDRPTKYQYDRFVYLVALAKKCNYNELLIRQSPKPNFLIVDVLFNTLWVQANLDLAKIANIIGEDPTPFLTWAYSTARAMNKILWTSEIPIYRNYDLVANSLVPVANSLVAAGFTPLYANIPNSNQALQMLKLMNSPHFCMLQEARNGTCWPIPTFDRMNQNFSTHNYWRGPNWINIDWILLKGLENYRNVSSDFVDYAAYVKSAILQLPQKVGFYEYFNPLGYDGHGSGMTHSHFIFSLAVLNSSDTQSYSIPQVSQVTHSKDDIHQYRVCTDNFSWTAALYIDIALRDMS